MGGGNMSMGRSGRGQGAPDERRGTTQLNLSLSAADKVALKTRAALEGTTVSRLVHEWIASWDGGGR